MKTIAERLWSKVDKSGDCWLWTASLGRGGYGHLGARKYPGGPSTTILAHRVAWELEYGPIPADSVVVHLCGNPPCVRPSHLTVMTWKERVLTRVTVKPPTDTKFPWSKIKLPEGCWEWTASKTRRGYGRTGISGAWTAHRLAWEFAYGPVPEGLNVLHTCDNPSCVRPDHLFLGTLADNIYDMLAKGRGRWQRGPDSER